jgi:hypothetical protein
MNSAGYGPLVLATDSWFLYEKAWKAWWLNGMRSSERRMALYDWKK